MLYEIIFLGNSTGKDKVFLGQKNVIMNDAVRGWCSGDVLQ